MDLFSYIISSILALSTILSIALFFVFRQYQSRINGKLTKLNARLTAVEDMQKQQAINIEHLSSEVAINRADVRAQLEKEHEFKRKADTSVFADQSPASTVHAYSNLLNNYAQAIKNNRLSDFVQEMGATRFSLSNPEEVRMSGAAKKFAVSNSGWFCAFKQGGIQYALPFKAMIPVGDIENLGFKELFVISGHGSGAIKFVESPAQVTISTDGSVSVISKGQLVMGV